MTALYIIAGIAVLLLICWIALRNSVAKAEVKVGEAESGIDVALTKRYDALTKMLNVTKGYAKHEAETLENVVRLRGAMTMPEKIKANAGMDEMLRQINILREEYPDLKASENFRQLQAAVMDAEEHLQAARRVYNANVTLYNNKLVTFPSNIVAKGMGKARREFFEADAAKRADVKMEF